MFILHRPPPVCASAHTFSPSPSCFYSPTLFLLILLLLLLLFLFLLTSSSCSSSPRSYPLTFRILLLRLRFSYKVLVRTNCAFRIFNGFTILRHRGF
jgi:hypothetical protein